MEVSQKRLRRLVYAFYRYARRSEDALEYWRCAYCGGERTCYTLHIVDTDDLPIAISKNKASLAALESIAVIVCYSSERCLAAWSHPTTWSELEVVRGLWREGYLPEGAVCTGEDCLLEDKMRDALLAARRRWANRKQLAVEDDRRRREIEAAIVLRDFSHMTINEPLRCCRCPSVASTT